MASFRQQLAVEVVAAATEALLEPELRNLPAEPHHGDRGSSEPEEGDLLAVGVSASQPHHRHLALGHLRSGNTAGSGINRD